MVKYLYSEAARYALLERLLKVCLAEGCERCSDLPVWMLSLFQIAGSIHSDFTG